MPRQFGSGWSASGPGSPETPEAWETLLANLRVLRWVGIIPLPAVDAAVLHIDLLAVYLIAGIGLMVGLSFRYLGEVYR